VDSRRWQAKKMTSKEDMAQNIPGRPDESQHLIGKRLNSLRRIVLSGVKLLPNVPTGTGGTKSKSK